jgi:hypothetical protein
MAKDDQGEGSSQGGGKFRIDSQAMVAQQVEKVESAWLDAWQVNVHTSPPEVCPCNQGGEAAVHSSAVLPRHRRSLLLR